MRHRGKAFDRGGAYAFMRGSVADRNHAVAENSALSDIEQDRR